MYGKISDLDNNPVSDAEIYLNGSMKAKSDKNGNFTFQCFALRKHYTGVQQNLPAFF